MVSRVVIFAVTALALCSALAVASTCLTEEELCAEDECCVKTGTTEQCQKLLKHDELCEVHPTLHTQMEHVYLHKCPCKSELKCGVSHGYAENLLGNCEEDTSEIPESPTEIPEYPTEIPEYPTEIPEYPSA